MESHGEGGFGGECRCLYACGASPGPLGCPDGTSSPTLGHYNACEFLHICIRRRHSSAGVPSRLLPTPACPPPPSPAPPRRSPPVILLRFPPLSPLRYPPTSRPLPPSFPSSPGRQVPRLGQALHRQHLGKPGHAGPSPHLPRPRSREPLHVFPVPRGDYPQGEGRRCDEGGVPQREAVPQDGGADAQDWAQARRVERLKRPVDRMRRRYNMCVG